jgi:hypothetical protein
MQALLTCLVARLRSNWVSLLAHYCTVKIQNPRGAQGNFRHDGAIRFLTSVGVKKLSLEAKVEYEDVAEVGYCGG